MRRLLQIPDGNLFQLDLQENHSSNGHLAGWWFFPSPLKNDGL